MDPYDYISRELAIAYCIIAYAKLKDRNESTEITYKMLGREIFRLMRSDGKPSNTICIAKNLIDFNNLNTDYFVQRGETIAYGIIAFHTLQTSGSKNNFTYDLLAKEIIDIMKINSPNVVMKRVENLMEQTKKDKKLPN